MLVHYNLIFVFLFWAPQKRLNKVNISRSLILSVKAPLSKVLMWEESTTLSRIAVRYSFLSIRLQSTQRFSERRSIRSSQMRVLRPLPSINGWTTFISTYLSAISSRVVSGIRSIVGMMVGKCRQLANVNPPFDIFLLRICPANSYKPPSSGAIKIQPLWLMY